MIIMRRRDPWPSKNDLTHLSGHPGGTDPPSSCQRSAVALPRPGSIDLWKVVLAAAGGSAGGVCERCSVCQLGQCHRHLTDPAISSISSISAV